MTTPRTFFSCTNDAVMSMTALFDFMWPTAEALEFLHQKLAGPAEGSVTTEAIEAEIPLKINPRARIALLKSSEEEARCTATLAGATLINVFAIFEAWIEEVLEESRYGSRRFHPGMPIKKVRDGMQFPINRGPDKPGFREVLRAIRSANSEIMDKNFGAQLRARRRSIKDDNHFEALLYAFRHFKEIRNAIVHRVGRANMFNVTANTEFVARVPDPKLLGITDRHAGLLRCEIRLGEKIAFDLRFVGAVNHLILILITSWETEFALTCGGEMEFEKRVRGMEPSRRNPSGDKGRIIRSICHHARLPPPADYSSVDQLFRSKRLWVSNAKRATSGRGGPSSAAASVARQVKLSANGADAAPPDGRRSRGPRSR